MGWILFALLIGVPLIEIYLFVEVGGWIGTWPTIGLVILTAIVGSIMLRSQGRKVLASAQEKIERGEPPVADLLDGIGLLLAGALLLTPGFLTDAVGFAMLLPPVRTALAAKIWLHMNARGSVYQSSFGGGGRDAGRGSGRDGVIDGEFEHVDPEQGTDGSGAGRPNDQSPWLPKS